MVGFGLEVQQNAMPQNGLHQRGDIFVGHVIAALHQRPGFGRQYQELRRADAGAEVDVLLDEIGRGRIGSASGAHQVHGVARDGIRDRNHADHLLEVENLFGGGDRLGLRDVRGGGEVQHLHFVVGREVIEQHVEDETVELGFGQRIGAFELDGVLRGQHEERRPNGVLIAAHRAGALLHGFEQRRLGLRRRAVDFVGQQHVGENRSGHEGPGAAAGGGIFFDDVGAGDVGGHQVGRELNAAEFQAQRLRQRAHQQRLGGARQAGNQAVSADKQRDHHLLDHFFLSHDHPANLGNDGLLGLLETRDPVLQTGGVVVLCGCGHSVILFFPTQF